MWSTIWDDSFMNHSQYKLFEKRVKKFGYKSVKNAIIKEVPSIITLDFIKKFFIVDIDMLALWEEKPQLYIFLSCSKIS